jgi:hypothetical protein
VARCPSAAKSRREASERNGVLRVLIGAFTAVALLLSSASVAPSVEAESSGVVVDNQPAAPLTATPERCPWARLGLAFFRGRFITHQLARGASIPSWRKPRNCKDARWLAFVWSKRSLESRRKTERHHEQMTLKDYEFAPGKRAWPRAVREVQRVFPGTESWLLSCSAAEGGHGRWVGYSGVSYSTWLRDSDTVGGPLQFRFSTFTGMFRRGAEHVRAKGYRLPSHLSDQTTAWRSALGQAIAGGWARYTGNDNSHWSASWGNGC